MFSSMLLGLLFFIWGIIAVFALFSDASENEEEKKGEEYNASLHPAVQDVFALYEDILSGACKATRRGLVSINPRRFTRLCASFLASHMVFSIHIKEEALPIIRFRYHPRSKTVEHIMIVQREYFNGHAEILFAEKTAAFIQKYEKIFNRSEKRKTVEERDSFKKKFISGQQNEADAKREEKANGARLAPILAVLEKIESQKRWLSLYETHDLELIKNKRLPDLAQSYQALSETSQKESEEAFQAAVSAFENKLKAMLSAIEDRRLKAFNKQVLIAKSET